MFKDNYADINIQTIMNNYHVLKGLDIEKISKNKEISVFLLQCEFH